MTMTNEIAIIRDGKVYRILAPPGTRIYHGDRAMDLVFDLVAVNGGMFLARQVLEMARTGVRGFRLVGFEPFPDE
jgi:hypothetical protein